MSERLTDEQLAQERAWLTREHGSSIHNPLAIDMIDELLALRARVAQMEVALRGARSWVIHFPTADIHQQRSALAQLDALLKDAPQ